MKFSIRDVMLVTVIVALAVGWWVDHRQNEITKQQLSLSLREKINKLETDLEKANASAETAWHILGHDRPAPTPPPKE